MLLVIADGFQQADHAHGHHVHGVFGLIETHPHMALGAQVVDFIRLDIVQHIAQSPGIRKISVMQVKTGLLVRVHIQMINAIRVEQRGPPHDPVDLVAL